MELDSCGKSVGRCESNNSRQKKLDVGWETLPENASVIPVGAIIIPYVQAETDRRPLAFIDPFRFRISVATQPMAGARTKGSRIA
jgi:hypothetical protein